MDPNLGIPSDAICLTTPALLARSTQAKKQAWNLSREFRRNVQRTQALTQELMAHIVKSSAPRAGGSASLTRNNNNHQARALRLVVNNPDRAAGPYISGRILCRDTPEMVSAESTRSAGTRPDLRHFWMAWYDTPILAANGSNPPPPSITRSTTPPCPLPPSVARLPMADIMQPLVADRQQPFRGNGSGKLQLVVVKTKDEARAEFAKNLNAELTRLGAPTRGRAKWLSEKMGGAVSREACRKYLCGLDMPGPANETILIDNVGLNRQFLRTGRWEPAPGAKDASFAEVEKAWPHLDDRMRAAILSVARAGAPAPAAEQLAPRKRRRT